MGLQQALEHVQAARANGRVLEDRLAAAEGLLEEWISGHGGGGDPPPDDEELPGDENPPPMGPNIRQLPRGTVYVMQPIWGRNPQIRSQVLERADGINLRFQWNKLQPGHGTYDFGAIISEIERARSLHKLIQITILDFDEAPHWLETRGASSVFLKKEGRKVRCFPQWDQAVRDYYVAMVDALLARVGPEGITHLHAPGADNAEWHYKQFKGFYDVPSVEAKILNGQKAMVERLVSLLSTHGNGDVAPILSINMGDYKRRWVREAVQWIMDNHRGRVALQANNLSAKMSLAYEGYRWVELAASKGNHAGFEMVSTSVEKRFGGSLEQALKKFVRSGAQHVQVYQRDLDRTIEYLGPIRRR